MRKIKVVENSSPTDFEIEVNQLLSQGFIIQSTSCGFVDSDKYDFCGSFQAILLSPEGGK